MAQASRAQPSETTPRNTIRMARGDLERLQEELDLVPVGGAALRRSHVRWPFRHAGVRIDVLAGGRVASSLHYACRNLSSGGLSFLHSTFMHTGTRCIVHLPRLTGECTPVPASVVRYRHYRGHVHEVAVSFDQPIELGKHIDLDPLRSRFSMERVDSKVLAGSLLHVEAGPTERRLLRHFLRETHLGVVSSESAADALARAKEGFDFFLIDELLPDKPGHELVGALREAGMHAPIILTAADPDDAMRAHAKASRASALLAKPLDEGMVLRALADLSRAADSGEEANGPVCSTLAYEDPARALLPEFIDELHALAKHLEGAIAANDLAAVRTGCQRIKGAAAPLGFGVIADAAGQAVTSLAASTNVAASAASLRALLSACVRAKADVAPEPARKAA